MDDNIYIDFIKSSSRGAIIGGAVMSSTALLAGSAAMELSGFSMIMVGYTTLMYIDYLDCITKCKLSEALLKSMDGAKPAIERS